MNFYEEKKAARIERLRERASKQREIAERNSFGNVTGEKNTGIPMGQPILVGHHSEKRHRKALERMDNKLRKGFEAEKSASDLEERARSAETRRAIDSDNPEALTLLKEKISKLEASQARYVEINKLLRSNKTPETLSAALLAKYPDLKDSETLAHNLLTPDFAGRVGIPDYRLTNNGAEIRRLKKRIEALEIVESKGFASLVVHTHDGDIGVELTFGQVQVEFPFKPCEETRSKLKCSPLALKWSSYSGRWVRKHTPATASEYFRQELIKVLEGAKP